MQDTSVLSTYDVRVGTIDNLGKNKDETFDTIRGTRYPIILLAAASASQPGNKRVGTIMAAVSSVRTRITSLFGCKYPIVLPGMSWISDPNLVSAVSEAGEYLFRDMCFLPLRVLYSHY